jgi:hypothetical protein
MYKVKLIKILEAGEITGFVNLPFIPQKGHVIEFFTDEYDIESDGIIGEIFLITKKGGEFSHFEVYLD